MSRRIAIVTGAREGIGRAIAVDLARHGHDVAVTDLEAGALEGTMAELAGTGARGMAVALDLRQPVSI